MDRKAPIDGHTWCPANATYGIWGGKAGGKFPSPEVASCWIDSIRGFYAGKVANAPGTEVSLVKDKVCVWVWVYLCLRVCVRE